MKTTSQNFPDNVNAALTNAALQKALVNVKVGFIPKRKAALDKLPEFEVLRKAAIDIRQHTLANLDQYLLQLEKSVTGNGGQVHWAENGAQANDIITSICQKANAKNIIKGKSMVGEETSLNDALEQAGMRVIESDLGEYIIQLAKEPPSHIIAPAVHKSRQEIIELFDKFHKGHPAKQTLDSIPSIVNEARLVLRQEYLDADVGITGANFLVADTGTNIIVTNEGNGDLSSTLPRIHIVIASIEKVVPTLEDASVMLRLLSRSATGQEITAYTSFFSGPRRAEDLDGPDEYHLVVLDNGRSEMFSNEFQPMLRCIRCGACLNHCPVYNNIGGHAYGWVYPGPMGSVLTPLMIGMQKSHNLPNASTFCGRCQEVCPMSIPLPSLLRHHREQQFNSRSVSPLAKFILKSWAWLARKPRLYRLCMDISMSLMKLVAGSKGRFSSLPFAANWTDTRDFPAPQGKTFISQYSMKQKLDRPS